MTQKLTALQVMQDAPVIPVIVLNDVAHAVPMARALVAGGIRMLEVTLRTPQARCADGHGTLTHLFFSDDVMDYLLTRFARDLKHLMALLDRLDEFSLSTKRAITVPLLRTGAVNLASEVHVNAGGKGVNVASCLADWGVPVVASREAIDPEDLGGAGVVVDGAAVSAFRLADRKRRRQDGRRRMPNQWVDVVIVERMRSSAVDKRRVDYSAAQRATARSDLRTSFPTRFELQPQPRHFILSAHMAAGCALARIR